MKSRRSKRDTSVTRQ